VSRPVRIALALGALVVPSAALAGCGGVPGDAVAKINGLGVIRTSDFNHWMTVAAASSQRSAAPGAKPQVPKPPDFKDCITQQRAQAPKPAPGQPPVSDPSLKQQCQQTYNGLRDQVLQFLISASWVQGEAKDLHVTVSDKEVAQQFQQTKQQSFPQPADFQRFLAQSGETLPDILFRVKLDALSNKIRTQVTQAKTQVSDAQISQYYNQNQSRYSQPERRDLDIVQTKSQANAAAALRLLRRGTPFKRVVARYSIDQASKPQGGLLPGVVKGQQEQAFDQAIFAAHTGVLTGPVKTQFGYYVFKVATIHAASQQSLAQVHDTIKQLLVSQGQTTSLQSFVAKFKKKWTVRTDCRSGFLVQDCKNFKAPPRGATGVPPGAQQVPQGSQQVPQGSQQVPQGSQQVPQGSQQVPQGSQQVPQGSQQVPQGSQQAPPPSSGTTTR